MKKRLSFAYLAFAAVLAMVSTGCSTFSPIASRDIPVNGPAGGAAAGGYSVEMSGTFKRPAPYEGVLSSDPSSPTTVQTALDMSGAKRHFRAMTIDVMRRLDNGRELSMPVEYEVRSRTVRPEQDYALHPGDRIVIRQKTGSSLDQLVGNLGIN